MAVNITFDPSSGSQNQTVKVSGNCNPGIDETIQFQVQTEDGSKTEIINVTQEGKREVLMVSDGQGGYTEFMPSDGGTFNVVKEEWKENPDCGPANGVYVYTTDGQFVKPEEWDTANNDQAVGVAVVSDNCKFVIAPEQNGSTQMWSKGGAYDNISGVTTTKNSTTAKADYQGVSNSAAIVAKYGNSTDYAAGWCQNYTFKNGKKGYLGSCGEWQEAYNNKSEIDACMSLIGGTAINTSAYHWTSTQYASLGAWLLRWSDGNVDYYNKRDDYRFRAFAAL